MPISIVRPSIDYMPGFLAMLADFEQRDPEIAEFYAAAKEDFGGYVKTLNDEEIGINLREGWVPCTHRWLIDSGGEVVGVTRLRHHIETPFLAANGGHIGYDVAPGHRGRGHGHAALRAALVEAAILEIPRVSLYTGASNVASRAVIERQGGVLEKVVFSQFWNEQLCTYWITVQGVT